MIGRKLCETQGARTWADYAAMWKLSLYEALLENLAELEAPTCTFSGFVLY